MRFGIDKDGKLARLPLAVGATVCALALSTGLVAVGAQTPMPAEASEAAATQQVQRSINVNATDSVKVQPDRAELVLGIRPQAQTADAARQAAADELDQLTQSLTGLGIEASGITSGQVSINPVYDWSESTQKITGYQADVTVTVKDLTLDQASSALTSAAAVADTSVSGLNYYVSTYDEQYQNALVSAMQAAQKKAEVLAGAAGASVGQVLSVQEGTDSQEYRYDRASLDSSASVALASASSSVESATDDITLNPGEVEISASVTVTYELQ